MSSLDLERIRSWPEFLPRTLKVSNPPIDLYAVARLRRIKVVGFREIIPRGLLLAVENGFEVYLQDHTRKDLNIAEAEPAGLLTPRQRFSLSHEIAHTLFYNMGGMIPTLDIKVSNGLVLESICDRTAGEILMPTVLLKRELSACARIDSDLVRSLAKKFHTSVAVAIERLSTIESSNPCERCVLLVRRVNADVQIRGLYFGAGLLPTIPRPKKFTLISKWLSDFPIDQVDQPGGVEITRKGRAIKFSKTELGSSGEFLLEAQVIEAFNKDI